MEEAGCLVGKDFTSALKAQVTTWGADLVGIADLSKMQTLVTRPPGLLKPFSHAVSIALALPVAVFSLIFDEPTPEYGAVYKTANRLLDEIAFKTSMMLQRHGSLSLPIPASQVLDREKWLGALSHKAVARMAGLGWQGKNLLLITPQFGSRVRLVTVLTKAPLISDGPIKNRCGTCTACQEACPAEAIKGVHTKDYYRDREEALYFSRCSEKLTKEFAALPSIGSPICGICINACPFGKKVQKKRIKNDGIPKT